MSSACRPRSLVVDTSPLPALPPGFVQSFPNVAGGKYALLAALPEVFSSVSILDELELGGNGI